MKKEEKMNFRTNKKRNSALLYEFLIRHISKCIIEDKKLEANKALEISKKFFSEGSPLRNELKLFQSVMSTTKATSRDAFDKIVEYACKSAGLMNPRILDEQKSKLIKEINYNLNKDVYDYKIPGYVNYSSLQLLFNESRARPEKKIDGFDRIKLKDLLITRLSEAKKPEELKVDRTYNNTVYKILVNKFHEKYATKLNENQKKFLIEYTKFLISEDKNEFAQNLKKEGDRIKKILSNVKDVALNENKDTRKSLVECSEKFTELLKQPVTEKTMIEFLQFIKLADEVES